MTPDEKRLELDSDRPDPDYGEHEDTYLMFTRIVKVSIIALPFLFAAAMAVTQ